MARNTALVADVLTNQFKFDFDLKLEAQCGNTWKKFREIAVQTTNA